MHVSELWVYPIKSCRGLSCDTLTLGDRGPLHDRRWMLVDDEGTFISQRTMPKLTFVDIALTPNLVVNAPGMPALEVLQPDGGLEPCTIFDDDVALIPAAREASEWFSEFTGKNCKLMYMPDVSERIVDRTYSPEARLVSLADGFPLLLIGQGSLDLLNSKLEIPVPMKRFRPNIVVAGSEPHAEDAWKTIRIGEVDCSVVKPCARCTIPTVDTETGTLGKEPSRTLATYRKFGSKILFGQNLIHQSHGTIHAGDALSLLV